MRARFMRISDQEFNRLRVLKMLLRAEPICRTDLARVSRLTGATITEISGALLARDLIVEEKAASGGRGRPRMHLRINPAGAYALGAYIGIEGKLVCEIVDLKGEAVFLHARQLPLNRDLEQLTASVAAIVDDAIAASPLDRAVIRCAGVALPAVVDTGRGVVHWVQTFSSAPFPVARRMEERIGIPVAIDNNTNVLARAEHWFGDGPWLDDFTLINIGYGISASHYEHGVLRSGAHGLNSEMGHAKIVAEGGLACTCGASGCLDAYCSITGLLRQACAIEEIVVPSYPESAALLSRLVRKARDGHRGLRDVFDRAFLYLAVALANQVNTFNPGKIVVLLEHPDLKHIFTADLSAAIRDHCLPPFRDMIHVEVRPYDQDMFRKGAAALVLERVYRLGMTA